MNDNYNFFNIRAAAILTNAYVAGTVLAGRSDSGYLDAAPSKYNQLILYAAFTKGSLTDAQIKVEYSNDGTTYFQESFTTISSGVADVALGVWKLSATGNYAIEIPIAAQYIKVSAIGTGTVTSSSLAIDAVLART